MGPYWTEVRDGARDATLKKRDESVVDTAQRWDQLLTFAALKLGLRVADVEASLTELRAGGVRVLSQAVREPPGLTYAYVAAPDGVVIELTEYE